MTEVKISITEDFKEKNYVRLFLRTVFHILSGGIFWSVFAYGGYLWFLLISEDKDVSDPNILIVKWFTPCYLTNWNFLFQSIFLVISLVYDILEWRDRQDSDTGKKLKFIRDVMFAGLVVPLTLFISSMFWTLFWIDRELVFPEVFDQLVPWWFNHCVHTNIAIVVLVETILQARRHPTHFKMELAINGIVGVLYAIVYYAIYFFAHRWLYAVFGIMTWWQVCLYQLLIWGSTFVFYFIQFPINRLFHKEEEETQKITSEKTGIQNGAYMVEGAGMVETSSVPESWLKHRSKREIENSSF